ncbi:hypothetical protein C3K47_19275 [Solitalea longa]|uniref:Uncharacterized protein n=1 Tax=Solitalea longa TaxID=2079460 RepID=A0A2S4ZW96_9SPHI|nr:hypothetical protein [Solitalea longa]POY34631.1 hypothetical protein C3K47_19275 [Solitalea longa]
MQVIHDILIKLNDFPELTYEFEKNDFLTVRSMTTARKLSIAFWEKEHTLFFEEWHWHFENNDKENQELINTIDDIITNRTRLKIFKRGEKAIAWELELPVDIENNNRPMTTGLFGFKFWGKREVEYEVVRFT